MKKSVIPSEKSHNSRRFYKSSKQLDSQGSKVTYNIPHLKNGVQSKSLKDKSLDNTSSSNSINYSSLFSSIIIILVGVAMVRLLYFGSADGVNFRSLLDLFSNVPQVSTSVKNFVQQLQISGNWGFIDGLRTFINMNLQMSSIVIWLASSLIDVCFFISYFLMWLFI